MDEYIDGRRFGAKNSGRNQDIKVGDKVTTPDGRAYVVFSAGLSVDRNYIFSRGNEPVTDTPQAGPDYNNGEWHGWNGGWQRPVHGECIIDHVWHDGKQGTAGITKSCLAKTAAWDQTLKFRVTKPYVEPKKPREVWLLIEDEYITDATFDGTDASKHGYVRAVLGD